MTDTQHLGETNNSYAAFFSAQVNEIPQAIYPTA